MASVFWIWLVRTSNGLGKERIFWHWFSMHKDEIVVLDSNYNCSQIANIKLPTSTGSWKKQESSRKTSISAIDYAKALDCVDNNKLWTILKEMGIPDHLTCLLRNLYAGQEATVRTGHGTTDCFQIGKGVHQGCILSPCLFNLYADYIMRNAGLDEAQSGIECWETYQ